MAQGSLAQRVAAFPQWHYEIDLGDGVVTPIFDKAHVNRHEQRGRYLFDPLVRLCGGSLAGKRVLDLGCNAGYWALKALNAGADYVVGLDGRQMHIDQANLVMEAKRVPPDRYRFEFGNIFDWVADGEFHIVLCFGLLYHVARPIELMERMARWSSDLIVIDTNLSRLPAPAFEVRHERTEDPRASIEYELVLRPTTRVLLDLAKLFGFQAVILKPRFTDWTGCPDFRVGLRRALILSRQTPLVGLATEKPRSRIVDAAFFASLETFRGLRALAPGVLRR